MNTREDFIICCRKLTDEQLQDLTDCIYEVTDERRLAKVEAEHRERQARRDREPAEVSAAEGILAMRDRLAAIRAYRNRTGRELRESANAIDEHLWRARGL